MESPAKEALILFIEDELPLFLETRGGRVLKDDARQEINARYRKRHGWSQDLDTPRGSIAPWRNAYGWAVRHLSYNRILKPAVGTDTYELTEDWKPNYDRYISGMPRDPRRWRRR